MSAATADRPIRIGLVIGQLTTGGAERQLLELVRHLDRRFAPRVYSLSSSATEVRAALGVAGVPVREIVGRGLGRVRSLRAALRADAIEVAHSWLFIANAYVAAASLPRAPWALVTSARNCKVQGRASQLANAVAFRMSRRVVVNSADVADYIVDTYAAPRDRIRVVVNGVDTARFHPDAMASEGPPHVVTVGRMVRQKHHELFLRAAAGLAARVPGVRFTIVGDGPLRADLVRLAARLGLGDRVTFAGERHDVDAIVRSAAVFWLTSRWEGMPNVVLEALACGVPVVSTAVSGVRELIEPGVQGAIVGLDDESGFVEHTAAWLGDPVTLAAMRAAARERALQFTPARMAAALASVYAEIIDR